MAEFSIHPIGTGTSVGKYAKRALQAISNIKGLEYQVTPMATILEAKDVQTILRAFEASHSALRAMGTRRISSILRIDERPRQTENDELQNRKSQGLTGRSCIPASTLAS